MSAGLPSALAEAVDEVVGRVTERDVEQEHERGEDDALGDGAAERDHHEHAEHGRRNRRALHRALPGGRLVQALAPALTPDRLRVLAVLGTARPAGSLDRAGGGAAVLALALAPG